MKLLWRIVSCLVLLLLVGVFALVAARQRPALPNSNGYDRLAALAATIPQAVRDVSETNALAVAQFASSHSNVVAETQAALRLPALMPLEYSRADVNRMQSMMDLRRLEKALLVCARHREDDGDTEAATTARLAVIELGQQGTRGDLMIHYMIGSAIQINALNKLSDSAPNLNADACQLALQGLAQSRSSQEPLARFAVRQRRWSLIGSEWWKAWDTTKELPRAIISPTEQALSCLDSPKTFFKQLNQAYDGTDSALRRRLAELEQAAPSRATP